MFTATDPAQLERWHEHFAMACNNRAWELSVQPRTVAQDDEMIDAAHASAWHWAQVGTPLHRMRATMLLAAVHALRGHGGLALAYAQEMGHFFLNRDTPDWELAFTHAVLAHAAFAAGRHDEHRRAWRAAADALAAVADDEDRAIVERTFGQVPRPDA